MSISIPAININSDTFLTLFTRVNSVIDVLASNTVTVDTTANGSLATGNGYVNGVMGVLTLGVGTLRGGNVQATATLNVASNVSLGNTTVNVALTTTGTILINGSLVANSTQVGLTGSYLTPTLHFVGNSTVNASVNSSALVFNGVQVLSLSGYSVGNVVITPTTLTVGNSTINTQIGNAFIFINGGQAIINSGFIGVGGSYMTNTAVGVGGNVYLSAVSYFVGNSTVNSTLSAASLSLLDTGSLSANTSRISLGSNVILYSSGNAVFTGYGSFGANLTVTAPEIILAGSHHRTVQGSYGLIQRFDGTNYWILFTNSADQYGSWNSLRPLQINAANGAVTMQNGLFVTGGNVTIGTGLVSGVAANSDVQAGSSSTLIVTPASLLGAMAFFTITAAATITINHQQGTNQTVTLNQNSAFAAPTNARVGWPLNVVVAQDATGGRVPTWNAAFDFADYGTPAGSTGANQSDLYTFLCVGTSKFAFLGIRRNI